MEPEVFHVPEAVGVLEAGVVAGGMLVADGQRALAPGGEGGVEDVGPVSGLDDERLSGGAIGQGGVAQPGDGGCGGPPGLSLLLGDVLPRRDRSLSGTAVGLIGGSCELFKVGAGHSSIMPEG